MSELTKDEIDLINCVAQTPAEALEYIKMLKKSKKRNRELHKPEDESQEQ